MKLIPLLEITFSDTPQVDREAGIIRGVRILGRTSRNGREYSEAALRQAARLYDRLGVNLNHPARPPAEGTRSVEDGFGWLEAIDVRGDGVYGDLHYFRAHPQADVIVEAALRNPRRFGLSHHAEGRVAQHKGKLVVEAIESVRSVDVVQNPATNLGLFESEVPLVSRTIREILEAAEGPFADLVEELSLHSALDRAFEVDQALPADRQLDVALQALLVDLLEDEPLDISIRLQRAARLLTARRTPAGPGAADPGEPVTIAQLLERVERIETAARCRSLLDAAGRACEPDRLEALARLATDDERRQLIETWPDRDPLRFFHPRPAVSRPWHEPLAQDGNRPGDVRSFVAAIR